MRREAGFTLIELVMVIVIASVLGLGVVTFIRHGVQGYVDTAERQQLAMAGTSAAEKISRQLRDALPNSIRIGSGGRCIEFIPVLAGSEYLSIPVTAAASSFEAVTGARTSVVVGRVVVYPISVSALYAPSNPGAMTTVNGTLPVGTGQVTVTLGAAHQFTLESPTRRFYLVDTPRAYCQVGSVLYRYSGYGFNATATLPPTGGTRTRVLDQLVANSVTFDYLPATLVRNAVVNLGFQLTDGGETFNLQQQAVVRNVP
ncbi:MAG: type II secretion system protein [Gammaproteobacteria bacterium]|nr:MAG: type II secretion system protein [Gammaproteobacteria bacterium]